MKNWLARLFGGPEDKPSAAPAAPPPVAPVAASEALRQDELDLLFYRWLAHAGAGHPCNGEALILDELARLGRVPGAAADLVPRMPAVIPQLLRSLRDQGVSGAELARQVGQDVVLVAEVIREANSSYFRPPQPVRTVEAAVMLLGLNGLRMLLARVAFRPVLSMQGGGLSSQVAPRIWAQSEKCALAASLLAPALGADPFEAYLAGLMHNVGLVVAFRVADQVCQDQAPPQSDEFCARLLGASRALSAAIARDWEFPMAVTHAIEQAGRAGTGPLATSLAQGDLLARLRVLLDDGVLNAQDPLLQGLAPGLRGCFDKLRSEED